MIYPLQFIIVVTYNLGKFSVGFGFAAQSGVDFTVGKTNTLYT